MSGTSPLRGASAGSADAIDSGDAVRVVSGDATDEEVVALVTALAAAATTRLAAAGGEVGAPSRWADREALLHLPPTAGPGAWTASAWRR